ncbi:accessory Sec system S-layer assembly protein [Rossellomorea aquimaris]|uniref:accessory Sec system S-layer assembly protein n=1 Tax=Rossellomorea aquimaris TaxID=189382 RepID=UPI0007D0A668|nr:accessory Sec system S-layer assembly protein [Rossellomorea aquimaris]
MMNIFKRKTRKNNDSNITSSEVPTNSSLEEENSTVKTSLIFHSDWEMSEQEKYVYKFKHAQLTPLKKNQISISGMKIYDYNEGFVTVAFIRNTLDKPIKFEEVDLLLLNENGQAFAKKRFDLTSLNDLQANSCMPWRFLFAKEDRLQDIPSTENWTIAFELKNKSSVQEEHSLELDKSWENTISTIQKEHLQTIVKQLPQLSQGELNLFGISAEFDAQKNLSITLLLRNGSNTIVNIEQLPIQLVDAKGDLVCKGGFKLNDFKVNPNTSKPWSFVFPDELVLKKNPDFSSWKVQIIQH